MSASVPPANESYVPSSTLGAATIGGFVTSIVYGITLLQSFIFFQTGASRHNRYTKATVILLCALNTLHMALIIHPLYWYTILNFTNPPAIVDMVWSIAAGIVLTAINDLIVRCWFIYRIWILSCKSPYYASPLILCVLALFSITLSTSAKAFQSKTLTKFAEIQWLLELDLSMLFIIDGLVAAVLCFLLAQYRKQKLSWETDSYINILIMYTIHTGLLTSMVSLACLITYVTMQDNYVFIAIFFPLGNLYANSLLASFNMPDNYLQSGRRPEPALAMPLAPLTTRHASSIAVICARCHENGYPTLPIEDQASVKDMVIHIRTDPSQAVV
ncbi:uncharacterized protein PHACADRAFT_254109 [Phanerochaete carnosa HHB-10118-sp]|uniref:DUF6534 domain-containing protein n=1 Tax=Phanerochaete carnosa (strain HHB-10118-sp) TaxID=650164 RepID=K5X1Z7_PHACS|nr:uncharacterized protein PHACADRAFT_254109 [Phanerochaete carnosa HHB-10118-sp]EKM56787.1 hypothetical protein PHACADRAFT_254109 [Phanerochaete carnosa HHB-10118-sp]